MKHDSKLNGPTLLGRIIAGVLMTAGVGLFGTFTAYVASYFVQQEEEAEEIREEEILTELKAIRNELEELKKSHTQRVDLRGKTHNLRA